MQVDNSTSSEEDEVTTEPKKKKRKLNKNNYKCKAQYKTEWKSIPYIGKQHFRILNL